MHYRFGECRCTGLFVVTKLGRRVRDDVVLLLRRWCCVSSNRRSSLDLAWQDGGRSDGKVVADEGADKIRDTDP